MNPTYLWQYQKSMFSYMFSNTNIDGYFSCVFVVLLFKKGMKAIKKKHVLSLIWKSRTRLDWITLRERTARERKMAVCLTCLFLCESVAILQWCRRRRQGLREEPVWGDAEPSLSLGRPPASLSYIHEHKCETVPKISDQVASCSRYDSWQKKKKKKKA